MCYLNFSNIRNLLEENEDKSGSDSKKEENHIEINNKENSIKKKNKEMDKKVKSKYGNGNQEDLKISRECTAAKDHLFEQEIGSQDYQIKEVIYKIWIFIK